MENWQFRFPPSEEIIKNRKAKQRTLIVNFQLYIVNLFRTVPEARADLSWQGAPTDCLSSRDSPLSA